ncbi:MAG: TonB-dependent receptor [Pseudomonadota bacterium]
MRKGTLIAAALSLVAAGHAGAQDAASTGTESISADDTIVVYGARLEQPMTEVGSSVTVITADQIEALNLEFALDAIALAPGVTINQNGTFGGSASIRIRGASSEQTLVIIDGVVVNDPTSPGGGFNFARLDPANIARIEVLKGPQSTLWGTDAIGGVINIITKRPQEAFGGRVFAQGGSFGSLRGGVEIGGAQDRVDYRLSVSSHSTDGISKADESNGNSEDDGFDSTSVNGSFGFNFGSEARIQANVLWTDAEAEFDSFSFGDQGNVADGDEVSETEELSANVTLNLPLLNGKLDNFFLIGMTDIDRRNLSGGIESFASEGDRTTYRYQGTLAINDSNRLAFGAEREKNDSNGEKTSIDGLFALYEVQPSDELTLSAGIRRDDHEEYGGETTGRLALAYNPTDQVTLSATWGEGFKAPTLFQTTFFCCGATEPNPDLRPERSEAFDLGVTLRSADGRGEVGLTYFDQDTTDLINFSFAVGGYENIAEAQSRGFELTGRYRFSEFVEGSMNYARIDATDGNDNRLVRVPEDSGNIMVTLNPDGRWSTNVLFTFNGAESDPNGEVPPWRRVDVSGNYTVSESVEIYARIENLFDESYQQIIGYGTPGLSGFVGARFSF